MSIKTKFKVTLNDRELFSFPDDSDEKDVKDLFSRVVGGSSGTSGVFQLIREVITSTTLWLGEKGAIEEVHPQDTLLTTIQWYRSESTEWGDIELWDEPVWAIWEIVHPISGAALRKHAKIISNVNRDVPFRVGWFENGKFITFAAYLNGEEYERC